MSCAMGTIRYILFFFNFLLALAGLAICITGVVAARTKGATFDNVVQEQLTTPAVVFAIVGACVFIFAFFGCCGALRESHCMIVTYAVLLLTLFLLQVAVAVLAYTFRSQTNSVVSNAITKAYDDYNLPDSKTKEWIDKMQQELQCCGSSENTKPWGSSTPDSCYPNKDRSKTIYGQGCIPTLVNVVEAVLSLIGEVAIIVGVVQVVGIVFALCLANSIRRAEMRGYA
ncbi:CD63 antigen-like [Homalodisca vitripennis]|uniref:CD63 antigen-like n=1 Tax=Homalodisca vitripennis TaxID=197043 RepID=UPI001EEB90F1|nr:CD63 antigen-like [Homalodisca vitripennis]